jgi:hypothetical protein
MGLPAAEQHEVLVIVFLMLVLKIPIAYLCWVLWWAIRAEPAPPEPAALVTADVPEGGGGPGVRSRRSRRIRPRGGPSRTYPRTPRAAAATARAERER